MNIYKPTRFSMPKGAWAFVLEALGPEPHRHCLDGAVLYAVQCWWVLAHGQRRYVGDRDYRRPGTVSLLASAAPRAASRYLSTLRRQGPMDPVSFGMTLAYVQYRAATE